MLDAEPLEFKVSHQPLVSPSDVLHNHPLGDQGIVCAKEKLGSPVHNFSTQVRIRIFMLEDSQIPIFPKQLETK